MTGIHLERPAARSLVLANRLPAPPKNHTGDPFTTIGDVVADCDVPGCGWHAMGARADVKKAIGEHRQMYHSTTPMVILLNHPR